MTLFVLLMMGGCVALCLSMNRHFKQVFFTGVPLTTGRVLKAAGWILLALSYKAAIDLWGGAFGTVWWVGFLTACGFLLIFSLPYISKYLAR